MHTGLVFGGSGLVGKAIVRTISGDKDVQLYATCFKHQTPLTEERSIKLNIADLDKIYNLLTVLKPQTVISCFRGNYGDQLVLHTLIAKHLKQYSGKL